MKRAVPAQAGFGLVEMMVALVIGVFLLAGAVGVYANSRTTLATNERMGMLQENARYALDLIEPDVRAAGFWGLSVETDYVTGRAGPADPLSIAVVNDCEVNWSINLDNSVQGFNNLNPYAPTCLFAPDAYQPGSDILVVRHAGDTAIPTADLEPGRIYLRADETRAQLFTGTTLPPGFGPEAQNFALVTHAYFVSGTSDFAPGLPSLRRLRLDDGGAQPEVFNLEIMPAVEDLQVQFGVDTDADGSVNSYVNPDPALDTTRIIAVRLWLRLRAEQAEPRFSDDARYLYADQDYSPAATATPDDDPLRRLLISKTVALRNRLAAAGN